MRAARTILAALGVFACALATVTAAASDGPDLDAVLVEENKSYGAVLDRGYAPALAGFAGTYGIATQLFAERHPSEPNYVALMTTRSPER